MPATPAEAFESATRAASGSGFTAPESGAFDAPVLDETLIARLRADLSAANWTVDALGELLSDRARSALARDQRVPALVELRGRADAASVLTRLFVLGSNVDDSVVEAALPTLGVQGASELGLVAKDPAPLGWGLLALVDLRPYSAVVPAPEVGEGATRELDWWIASDRTSMQTGRALRADHVLGVGGASTSLLEMTIRESVDSALDMGCGCGIQAMHLATHAKRVVATDLSERCCAFTRFNAALNALDVEVRAGSLFEPVAGESFDLIVTNPPFVITPNSLRADGLLEYRDGGMSRDELVRAVVRQGPEHLVPGGVLQMIGNWEIPVGVDPDAEWSTRLEPWFECLPVDAWVVQRDVLDPARYVEMWLQDADPTADAPGGAEDSADLVRACREEAYRAWLRDFDEAGVGGVGMGFLAMRRLTIGEGGGARVFDLALAGARPRGVDVARTLKALRLPEDLSGLRLVRAEDVTEERHYVPGSADPRILILHQGSGLGRSIRVGTAASAIVGASDGELEVGQIVAAVALLTDRDAAEVAAEVDEPLRELLRAGMLSVVE